MNAKDVFYYPENESCPGTKTFRDIQTSHWYFEKEVVEILGATCISRIKLRDTPRDYSTLDVIQQMKQLPQVQFDLKRQLEILRIAANKLGLYDAADFLKSNV